jgi:hypothetical protein
MPVSATTGELYMHTPIGRKVLYQYDGSEWKPVSALGNITIYVDSVAGTDNIEYGFGSGSDAFRSINFALSVLPESIDNLVVIFSRGDFTWSRYEKW